MIDHGWGDDEASVGGQRLRLAPLGGPYLVAYMSRPFLRKDGAIGEAFGVQQHRALIQVHRCDLLEFFHDLIIHQAILAAILEDAFNGLCLLASLGKERTACFHQKVIRFGLRLALSHGLKLFDSLYSSSQSIARIMGTAPGRGTNRQKGMIDTKIWFPFMSERSKHLVD